MSPLREKGRIDIDQMCIRDRIWEPLWIFARRKSATVPLAWLSRRPEWLFDVGMAFSRKGLATVAEVIGEDGDDVGLLSRGGYHDTVHYTIHLGHCLLYTSRCV